MSDPSVPSGPSSSGPPDPPPPPGSPSSVPSGPPSGGRGLSTGAKLLIGCLGLGAVGFVLVAVAVGVGGFALKRGVESALGGLEDHGEATEALERVEREHPFDPPDDGRVTEEQVRRFMAVTDDAWREMRAWADDLDELREREVSEAERPRLGDLAQGVRAVAGLGRSRVALAAALEDHDTSLGEYAWVGLSLSRAEDALERGGGGGGVPPENVRLVEEHRAELPRFADADGRAGPRLVLVVATLWGMGELGTWRALGLDTLASGAR